MAPRAGFEPATNRLTAGCSTAELPGNTRSRGFASNKAAPPLQSRKIAAAHIYAQVRREEGRGRGRGALLSPRHAGRRRRHARNVTAIRGRKLGDAAGEVAQMQPQLVECKAEGENALYRVVRQFPR
jgi:hypothetical protein